MLICQYQSENSDRKMDYKKGRLCPSVCSVDPLTTGPKLLSKTEKLLIGLGARLP